ncbi:methyltransferase domain-containing protein [bacterium]|nr:methyltransferase domain-containing protein [bacterium]MBU4510704.1 methyltransferase domain-containing protein [bacterium]
MGLVRYPGILKSDLVLDVGSGNYPYPRANVVCDKYEKDNTERGGKYLPETKAKIKFLKNRIFIVAEGENLPFKDKSFDYVICSHVVEHSENPDRVLEELMRVASRGYIETPSEILEMLFGWSFHKWYVRLKNNMLVLKRKKTYNNLGSLISYFLKDFNFAAFYIQNKDLFIIRYYWNKKINYKIINQNDNLDRCDNEYINLLVKKHFKNRPNNIFSFIKKFPEIVSYFINDSIKYKIFNLIYYSEIKKKNFNLEKILACPKCKSSVVLDKGAICANCKLKYPIKDGIIYMKISDGVTLK